MLQNLKPGLLKQFSKVLEGLETHSYFVELLLTNYLILLPTLNLGQFIIELGKDKKDLKNYLHSFDKDPKGASAPVQTVKDFN